MAARRITISCALLSLAVTSACATARGPASNTVSDIYSADERRMMTAALEWMLPHIRADVVCVSVTNRDDDSADPDQGFLQTLDDERVVSPEQCPETYTRMITPMDSLGQPIIRVRPEGYDDPHHLLLRQLRFEGEHDLAAIATVMQGTSGTTWSCTSRILGDAVEAECRFVSRWIS